METSNKASAKFMTGISVSTLVLASPLLVANLMLLYHLGDADGNPRTMFGNASAVLDEYLVAMRPGGAVTLVLVTGTLLWGSLQMSIMSAIFAKRSSESRLAAISLRLGVALAVVYLVGLLVVLAN